MADWADAVKAAMKILGPKGKIPDFPKTLYSTGDALGKSWEEFVQARKNLKEKFDAHIKDWDKYQGARLTYIDDIERGNLGLNQNDKAEGRKIVEARKPLLKYLTTSDKWHQDNFNKFKKLSSHVTTLVDFVEPD
jgi:hypothetical protein